MYLGDFNAPPSEPAYAELGAGLGLASAHVVAHGTEPDHTFPTGLQAPTMDTDPPLTTVRLRLRRRACRVRHLACSQAALL